MDIVTSKDGTPIAYAQTGDGRPVVVVNGALSTAADAGPLAAALRDAGYRAVTYDRRSRGESGDAAGSAPEREAEDLAAVIAAAGDDAAVLGHSSGAVLTLFAASLGVPMRALFLSEPPFLYGTEEDVDLADRLQSMVDAGAREEAIATFQIEGVGLPREMVEGMRAAGQLTPLAPLAQSTVYDARLTRQVSTPTAAMLAMEQPITVLRGEQTFPVLVTAAERLAAECKGAELVVVPESIMHRPDPAATVRVVSERLTR